MSNKINNNLNNIELELKSYNEKLGEMCFNNLITPSKIKSELNNLFKILLKVKNDAEFTSYCEKYLENIIYIIDNLIDKKIKDITLNIIQELYFFLSNIKSNKILLLFYSAQKNIKNEEGVYTNIFDKLISINDFNNNEEFLSTQVNLMKSLILKLDSGSILYFYKNEINQFPILNKSLYLYDHSDSMIKSAINNILLLITKIKNSFLMEYLASFPVALYYPMIIYNLKDVISKLNFTFMNKKNFSEYYEEKHEELYSNILYLNDILLCNNDNINFILINCLLNEIIFPLFNVIISKTKEKISIIDSIYVLSFFIFFLKNDFIINIICYFLLSEKINTKILTKIRECKYELNNENFMEDINYLIKNISDADINDKNWKKNAKFIINEIGIDLSTNKRLLDNNYDFIKNLMNNKNINEDEFTNNEIFICIKELFTSDDENVVLKLGILFYIIINYYINYLKKESNENKDNIVDNGENIIKNKIKNIKIPSNDLNLINNKYNQKNKKNNNYIKNESALFNPFLLPFCNFTKNSNNNLINLVLNLIKKRDKFRIFTNELLLNILTILIKIFCIEQNYYSNQIFYLIRDIKIILKEEINKVKIIFNEDSENLNFNDIISIYNYYKKESFDIKIKESITTYYLLIIPFMHSEKNDRIPFSLKEEKTKDNNLKNNMLNIFILIDLLLLFNKKAKLENNFFNELKSAREKEFEIGNIYNKNTIGNEYGFCFISYNLDNFKFSVENIKKCLFIIYNKYFYLGEIISKTFKKIDEIKIINKIPLINVNVQEIKNEENYLEINDNRNENKLIMNCFNEDNTKKVFQYFKIMKENNNILYENSFYDFIKNIEDKILK